MSDAKPEIWFYHLERSTLDEVLPGLMEKTRERGWRALVRAADPRLLDEIDERLWTWRDDSFLAHGRAGAGGEAHQPILLGATCDAGNGARHIALADGVWRDEALGFERAFYFFDADTIDGARASWRVLSKANGVEPRFWRQDGRKWVQGP